MPPVAEDDLELLFFLLLPSDCDQRSEHFRVVCSALHMLGKDSLDISYFSSPWFPRVHALDIPPFIFLPLSLPLVLFLSLDSFSSIFL